MKQISIFLQNTNGQLAELVELFSRNNINLRAMSLADTQDYGILRLIAETPEKAEEMLKAEGYAYSTTEVAAIPLPDRAGALAEVVRVCAENQIGIEYAYAFLSAKPDTACLIGIRDQGSGIRDQGSGIRDQRLRPGFPAECTAPRSGRVSRPNARHPAAAGFPGRMHRTP